ncbi:MAG: SpaA isopeptide-forming pilin-related protein, partial [Bacteroidales bacterium]
LAEPIVGETTSPILYDIRDKSNPASAFSELNLTFGTQVGDSNNLFMKFQGKLNQIWAGEQYEQYLITGKDESTWEIEDQSGTYKTYAEFLDARSDSELQEISFTCRLSNSESVFEIGNGLTASLQTDSGETIGSYTIAQDKKDVVLTCKLRRSMYYTSKLEFGFTMFLNFSKNYQSGTPITVVPGTNGSDFIVTPDPSGEEIPKDTGYSIKKTAKQEGTTGIVYTIEAGLAATASDATSSDATSSDASSSDATSSTASSSSVGRVKTVRTKKLFQRKAVRKSLIGRASASNPDGQNNLIGKVITDQIPEGLVITSITSTIDTFEPASVYPAQPGESSSCTVANNLITYTVPALASGIVETVKLEIHTMLSDVFYNEYMKKGTAVELSFPNKAFLKGDNTTLAISDRVIPKLKLVAPFNKEGHPLDSSNKSFRWTLSVNSQFSASSSVALYAVDHIADINNTHDYRVQDGITIKPRTGTEIHKSIIKGELPSDVDASAYTYEKLIGIAKIEEVIQKLYPNVLPSESDNDAIMYTYPVSQNRTDAVMLIPLTGFTNQEVKISYITDARIPDYANLNQAPKQLENNAKILWRWNHGDGITSGEEVGGASINKTYPVSYSLVNKTAAPYNDQKNTITWSFEVNQLAVDQIHSMDITDQFDNTELRLTGMKTPGGDTWAPLTLTPVKGIGNATESNARRVPYWDGTKLPKPTGDYYQITESATTGTNPTTTFKLHLAELSGTDHYRFSLETKVLKLDSSSDNNNMNIQNKAQVEAIIDKTPVNFDTTADCWVKNTIIRKWTIPTEGNEYYDYRDNTVKWRITINPHSRVLHEAVLTDRLPSGIQLASWTGVGVGTEITAGSIPQKGEGGTWTVTLPQKGATTATTATTMTLTETEIPTTDSEYDPKSNGHPQKRLEFRFSGSQASPSDAVLAEPVTVEFTTTIAETYRKEKFKSTGVEIKLNNKATLTGKVDGSSNGFTASDTAENRIKPLPMIKSGIYKKNQPVLMNGSPANLTVIDWSLLVNRTCMDIGGATLSDVIPNCMELLPDTMKVEAVKLKTNGMVDEAIPPALVYEATSSDASGFDFHAADGTGTAMNEYGFSCTIPSDKQVPGDGSSPWNGAKVQSSTLRFTFRTVMVNDAYAADITNKASLQINGITDTTSNADVTGKSDFNTADYATAEGVYFTKIYKTTVNASQIYPLDQTKFKIEKLITPGGGSGSEKIADWNQVDTSSTEKVRTTNAKGTLTFMFMKPGAMYRITETEPHFGYARPDDVWFVVIKDLKPGKTGVTYPAPDDNADGTKKITMGDKKVPYHLYIHDASAANPNYKILEIKNKINETISGNGMISFVKRGHNGQLLPGVKFTLSHRLFATKATMSDASGKVTFDQVDPNDEYYTISETTPQGYRSLTQPLQVRLTLEKNGGNPVSKVEFKNNVAYTESSGTELGTLSNTPITGSGSFKKVDQNGTAILTPIYFKVTRRGDGGQVLGGSSTPSQPIVIDVDASGAIGNHTARTYYEYLPQQTIRTSQGIATFTDYPYGDYCFEELPSDAVLLVPGETMKKIYVHIDETGVWASDHCESSTGKAPDGTGGGTKLTVSDGTAYQVTNRLQYGFVQIHKVVGEKHVDGTIIPLTHGSNSPIPLSGVKFDIYRDMNSNKVIDQGETPIISNLSTDADGKFVINPCVPTSYENSYHGTTVQLTTGHYILQEQSPTGFETKSTIYPFVIPSWGNATEPTTVYVGDSTVTSGQEAQQLLYNVPLRKPVRFNKIDSVKADKL